MLDLDAVALAHHEVHPAELYLKSDDVQEV